MSYVSTSQFVWIQWQSADRVFTAYSRYINFYGQKGARLTNDQTIYGYQPKRTYLIKTLSIFFFYAPELHLAGTHGSCVLQSFTETS